MRRTHATIAVATLVLAGVAIDRSRAGPGDLDLASHLPADALVYLTLDDLGQAWDAFPKSRLGRIFSDPKVVAFFERLSGGSASQRSGIQVKSSVIGLPVLIGTDVELTTRPGRISVGILPPRKGAPEPGVVATLAVGESKTELARILNSILSQLQHANPEVCSGRIEDGEHSIGEVCVYDIHIHYFWHGGNLVVGTRRSDVDGVLRSVRKDAESDKSAPVLASSSAYRDLRRRTGESSGGTFLYVDPSFLLADLTRSDRREAAMLGLTGIRGFALRARTVDDGLAEAVMRLNVDRVDRGLFGVLGEGRGPFRLPACFPENVVVSVSGRLDPEALVRLVSRLSGPEVLRVRTPLALERPWMVELADSVGGEAGLWMSPAVLGTFNLGVAAELRNPRRARRALIVGLRSGPEPAAKIIRIRGQIYFHLQGENSDSQITTVTVHGDTLYAGSSIGVVRDMIRRSADPEAKSLGASKTFRDSVDWTPEDAAAILYVDTPRLFKWGYQYVAPFMVLGINLSRQNADPDAPPLSWPDFPPAETFTKHLTPAVTWVRKDDGGLTARTRSSVMGEVPVLSGLTGMGVALVYLVQRKGEQRVEPPPPVRVKGPGVDTWRPPRPRTPEEIRERQCIGGCRTNLSIFRQSFLTYRKTHGGKPPPSLAAFYGDGPAQGPHFICPADLVAWTNWKKDRQAVSSYVYVGREMPTRVEKPGRFLLVWDRMPFHGGRRNALFLDGSIRLLREGEYQRLLEETRRLQRK